MKNFQNTLGECLSGFWTNYANWGRATRAEYWWCYLFYYIIFPIILIVPISFVAEAVSPVAGMLVNLVYYLSICIPSFCLTARRLHDTNRSNWNMLWILLPFVGVIILLVYLCQHGDAKTNNFGEPRI